MTESLSKALAAAFESRRDIIEEARFETESVHHTYDGGRGVQCLCGEYLGTKRDATAHIINKFLDAFRIRLG